MLKQYLRYNLELIKNKNGYQLHPYFFKNDKMDIEVFTEILMKNFIVKEGRDNKDVLIPRSKTQAWYDLFEYEPNYTDLRLRWTKVINRDMAKPIRMEHIWDIDFISNMKLTKILLPKINPDINLVNEIGDRLCYLYTVHKLEANGDLIISINKKILIDTWIKGMLKTNLLIK